MLRYAVSSNPGGPAEGAAAASLRVWEHEEEGGWTRGWTHRAAHETLGSSLWCRPQTTGGYSAELSLPSLRSSGMKGLYCRPGQTEADTKFVIQEMVSWSFYRPGYA